MTRKGAGAKGSVPAAEIFGLERIGVVVNVPLEVERAADVKEDRTGPQGPPYRSGGIVATVMGLKRFYNGNYAEYALLDPISVSAPLMGIDPSRTQISAFASLAAAPATFFGPHMVSSGLLFK
jgi:hypothetical protein